jgi:hypothetical protein
VRLASTDLLAAVDSIAACCSNISIVRKSAALGFVWLGSEAVDGLGRDHFNLKRRENHNPCGLRQRFCCLLPGIQIQACPKCLFLHSMTVYQIQYIDHVTRTAKHGTKSPGPSANSEKHSCMLSNISPVQLFGAANCLRTSSRSLTNAPFAWLYLLLTSH